MPWTLPILKKMGVQVTVFNKDLQRYFVQIVEQIVNSRKAGDTVRLVFIFLENIFLEWAYIYIYRESALGCKPDNLLLSVGHIKRLKQRRVANHSIHVLVVIKANFSVSRRSFILSKVFEGLSGTVYLCVNLVTFFDTKISSFWRKSWAAPKVSSQSVKNMSKWRHLISVYRTGLHDVLH